MKVFGTKSKRKGAYFNFTNAIPSLDLTKF